MKYFTIGTLALTGLTHAALDAATTALCTGDAAEQYANQEIADAGGDASDYVIKYNDLKSGNFGKFLTIMCKAAPWQHNGDVYDPYKTTKWDAVKAEEYAKYAADSLARDTWFRANVANLGYPAGSGGKAWCGYKGDGSNNVEWHFIDATPLCPNHDEVNAWNEFYEASKSLPLKVWPSANAISAAQGYKYADIETFTQYELSFNLKINKKGPGSWRSLVHIGNSHNDRRPGIWLHPGTEFDLHIMQTSCGGLDDYIDDDQRQDGFDILETGWDEGENHHFMMRVTRVGNHSEGEMRIFLDGEDQGTRGAYICDDNSVHAFYLGAPWYETADVEYANIEYKEIQ